jgi:hypothetical protein
MGIEKISVAVLGWGFPGVLATRALLKDGHHVVIKDKNKTILGDKSTSQDYPLSTGMDYIGNLKKAEHCLLNSINFARDFPDCILDYKNDGSSSRIGRYYFVSKSLFALEAIQSVVAHLREVYTEKVKEDTRN